MGRPNDRHYHKSTHIHAHAWAAKGGSEWKNNVIGTPFYEIMGSKTDMAMLSWIVGIFRRDFFRGSLLALHDRVVAGHSSGQASGEQLSMPDSDQKFNRRRIFHHSKWTM